MILCYIASEIWHIAEVIVIFHFGQSLVLLPPYSRKNENVKKNEKNTLRYHHLTQVYQKSSSIAPEIWQMVDAIVIFSFWAIFTIPPSSPKNENLKTFKKHLEISSLYTSIPKIMIICYTVPEIYGARGM